MARAERVYYVVSCQDPPRAEAFVPDPERMRLGHGERTPTLQRLFPCHQALAAFPVRDPIWRRGVRTRNCATDIRCLALSLAPVAVG